VSHNPLAHRQLLSWGLPPPPPKSPFVAVCSGDVLQGDPDDNQEQEKTLPRCKGGGLSARRGLVSPFPRELAVGIQVLRVVSQVGPRGLEFYRASYAPRSTPLPWGRLVPVMSAGGAAFADPMSRSGLSGARVYFPPLASTKPGSASTPCRS